MEAPNTTYAYERKHKHEGRLTYQFDNPVKDGHTTPGVVWQSTLVITTESPVDSKDTQAAKVGIWAPGMTPGRVEHLLWGTVLSFPVADWAAHINVVSYDDVPLRVFIRTLPGVDSA